MYDIDTEAWIISTSRQFARQCCQEDTMSIVAEWIAWAHSQADMYQQLASELEVQELIARECAIWDEQARSIPSVAHPVLACAWCWRAMRSSTPFPEAWSSTICEEHSEWMMEQAAARRVSK